MTTPSPQPRLPALCPYCGHGHDLSPGTPRPLQCQSCNGRFEPLSRQATQNAMGPWQIRDPEQPFRPPCSYDTIARLAQRGKITATTIVRGPTTRQFWAYARDTPGIAAILGLCHSCHTAVSPDDQACPSCEAVLRPTTDRQQLGLSPIAPLPGEAPPEQIAALIRPRTPQPMPPASEPSPEPTPEPSTEPVASPHPVTDPPPPSPRSRRARKPSPWPKLIIVGQTILLLALGAILIWQIQRTNTAPSDQQRSAQRDPQPADPAPSTSESPGDDSLDRPDQPDTTPDPAPPPAPDLNTLMDEAMRPFESRYWPIVEATRSNDTATLTRAISQLEALRAEAAAADPDAAFPLTDDLIDMAQERLDQLRLMEQFSDAP